MTTVVVGELVTRDGANLKHELSLSPEHFWAPLRPKIWTIPASEVRSIQGPEIPLRLRHGGPPAGRITALERRDDGSVWAAGEIKEDIYPEPGKDYFLSVEAEWDEGDIGRNIEIRGASLCEKSCMVALAPAKILRSGLDASGRAPWLNGFERSLLDKGARYQPWAGKPIIIEGTRVPSLAARASSGPLELRSAAVVDLSPRLREVDLLIVPHEVPSTIFEHNRSYDEVFTVGAFASAEANPGKVKLNHAHRIEAVVGKAVEIDAWAELGCIGRFRIAKVAAGDEALELLSEDLVTPSAGFTVPKGVGAEEWRGSSSRRIRRANLHHVGLTADAAHKTAVLGIRSQHALR